MILRNIVLLAALAVFQAGCIVVSQPSQPRDNGNRGTEGSRPPIVLRPIPPRSNDSRVNNGFHDYRSAPSYEGYDYARVIFINNIPHYVHDDRRVRPIPPQLHDHFRRYPYGAIGRPLVFSGGSEVRDGYPLSRIVYLNDVPYHVTDDRIAWPLPGHLHLRFRYLPSNQAAAPAYVNRPQPPIAGDGDRRSSDLPANAPAANTPPAWGREHDRNIPPADGREHARMEQPSSEGRQRDKGNSNAYQPSNQAVAPVFVNRPQSPIAGDGDRRNEPPALGRERVRNVPPAYGREHARMGQPSSEGEQRDKGNSNAPSRPDARMMPPPGRNDSHRIQPMRPEPANPQQNQQKANEARAGTPAHDGRNRNDVGLQANNNASKKDADKQETSEDKGDGANKKGTDEKKSRGGKDNNPDDRDNGKGTKRD